MVHLKFVTLLIGLLTLKTCCEKWIQVQDAPWHSRAFFSACEFNNMMYITAGSYTVHLEHHSDTVFFNDVWRSGDGVLWESVASFTAFKPRDSAAMIVFNKELVILGGNVIPDSPVKSNDKAVISQVNDVWTSKDGVAWRQLVEKAPWTPRDTISAAVFRGFLWIFGGYHDDHTLNDIWRSHDGKTWHRLVLTAPWKSRHCHTVKEFRGKLYLIGGEHVSLDTQEPLNDVWSSVDGVQWNLVRNHAPWSPRILHASLVYNGFLWFLGGAVYHVSETNIPSIPIKFNDVFYSRDGNTWIQASKPNWVARDGESVVSFKGDIFLMGGQSEMATQNDVWKLYFSAFRSTKSGFFIQSKWFVVGSVLVLVVIIFYFVRKKRARHNNLKTNDRLIEPLIHPRSPSITLLNKQIKQIPALPRREEADFSDDWLLEMRSIILNKKIGSGATSQVYEASYCGNPVAVKEFFINRTISRKVLRAIKKEALLLSELHHPNLIRLFGVAFHQDHIYLVTEICDMSLQELIDDKSTVMIPFLTFLDLCLQICHGLSFLHARGIIHRDLKPSNVLIVGSLPTCTAKICDLGLARHHSMHEQTMTGALGTPVFCAPEVMTSESIARYSQAADVYSFGILLWCFWSRKLPYIGKTRYR
eukprot:TRINITY_DN1010_c0_g1_i4.p1 TRINITY_DN1010_c0_g1~~TRINITY_DN1010_c0_g1_i4.p1  ORF type:complete len:643 (-),score=58.63 TRINITY_DN1010_c0_g1_i4:451-2379(-)